MGSRLGHDGRGGLIVVVTTPAPELPVGLRLRVVGNSFAAGGKGIGFLGGRTGGSANDRREELLDRLTNLGG